jgi:hypothetical protein
MTPAMIALIESVIAFALQEAPQVGQLIASLQAAGRASATADEIAALASADTDFAAAYARCFPGQVPPAE